MGTIPAQYRGIPVPLEVSVYWHQPIGRWWRAGIDAKAATMPFVVEPGQIYADNDPRSEGRTLLVEKLDGVYADCLILTDRKLQDLTGGSQVGKPTRIKIRRLYPNARGYRLIEEPQQRHG